jgi:hypothetical protein
MLKIYSHFFQIARNCRRVKQIGPITNDYEPKVQDEGSRPPLPSGGKPRLVSFAGQALKTISRRAHLRAVALCLST